MAGQESLLSGENRSKTPAEVGRINRTKAFLGRFVDITISDPDDQRRARLLNVLLVAVSSLTLIAIISSAFADTYLGQFDPIGSPRQYIAMGTALAGMVLIFLVNRIGLHLLAGVAFLILLSATLIGGHTPYDVVWGRGLFFLTIPILIASVLVRPTASFVMAVGLGLVLLVLAGAGGFGFNPIAIVGMMTVAMVSWMSSSSLERALRELRLVNRELDERVAERTQDLTGALARERAEASKNQAILSSIADGVVVFDTELLASVANPSIRSVMGLQPERLIGRHILDLMQNNVGAQEQEQILAMLKHPDQLHPSMQIEWMDRTLSISFAPIQSELEALSGTVAVIRDFTREAEIDRMKSDFVSIASHELKTPLTAIQSYLELLTLTGKGNLTDKQHGYLDSLMENMHRLRLLVEDLLDVSRIESGQLRLQQEWVDLGKLIEGVVADMSQEFESKGLDLKVNLPDGLPAIRADRHRLIQIMFNLLSNAHKYTEEGQVTITVRHLPRQVQIAVADTGLGISLKDQERLFARFFRANDLAVRTQTGTGLGLNITRSLLELHGGQIAVDSEPGQGSVFTVTLPIIATASATI